MSSPHPLASCRPSCAARCVTPSPSPCHCACPYCRPSCRRTCGCRFTCRRCRYPCRRCRCRSRRCRRGSWRHCPRQSQHHRCLRRQPARQLAGAWWRRWCTSPLARRRLLAFQRMPAHHRRQRLPLCRTHEHPRLRLQAPWRPVTRPRQWLGSRRTWRARRWVARQVLVVARQAPVHQPLWAWQPHRVVERRRAAQAGRWVCA